MKGKMKKELARLEDFYHSFLLNEWEQLWEDGCSIEAECKKFYLQGRIHALDSAIKGTREDLQKEINSIP